MESFSILWAQLSLTILVETDKSLKHNEMHCLLSAFFDNLISAELLHLGNHPFNPKQQFGPRIQ